MNLALITDGPLETASPVHELKAKLDTSPVAMTGVDRQSVAAADVVVVELLNASDAGLEALRAKWRAFAARPVICVVSRSSRRESFQAGALGAAILFDRDHPAEALEHIVRDAYARACGVPV